MFGKKVTICYQRKYIRVNKDFKVEYAPVITDNSLPVKYDVLRTVNELKYSGHTRNISEEGLCLEVEDIKKLLTSIKKNTQLKLRISIPGETVESIDAIGKIIWKDMKNTLCGIEFTQIFPEDRMKIRNLGYTAQKCKLGR